MRIKKVGAICNAGGCYYLMDERDAAGEIVGQWLGDGKSAYPLVGLPVMDLENICAMFDITEKKREKLVMRRADVPDSMNWEDTAPLERQLDDPKLCVRYDGRDLLPLERRRASRSFRKSTFCRWTAWSICGFTSAGAGTGTCGTSWQKSG